MKAELVSHNNDDLTVVNAARVSFDKKSETITDGDVKLIHYLANHDHWTPFAHSRFTFVGKERLLYCVPHETEIRQGLVFTPDLKKVRHSFFGWVQLLKAGYVNHLFARHIVDQLRAKMPVSCEAYGIKQLEIRQSLLTEPLLGLETDERFIDHTVRETVPIFVARQRFKHTVDIDYNEVSRRYVSDTPEFYWPGVWRGAPTGGAKQGSSGGLAHSENELCNIELRAHENASVKLYETLLKRGVAPEQARMVLPQSMMTSYYVTGSLISWKRSFGLRIDVHAQKEIRDLAVQWGDLIEGLVS